MDKAQAGYDKAAEALAKQQTTIERHKQQLDKMVAKFERDYIVSLHGQDLNALDAYKWPGGNANPIHEMYWHACYIEGKMDDIRRAERKLIERKEILAGWEAKVSKTKEKAKIFNDMPQIIHDFVNAYKIKVIGWYNANVERATNVLEKAGDDYKARQEAKRIIVKYMGSEVLEMVTFPRRKAEIIEKESERRRVGLLETLAYRTREKVGRITDAAGLYIGENGEINGFVSGEKGTAEIRTIEAGGWNIQCWHYRVLVL